MKLLLIALASLTASLVIAGCATEARSDGPAVGTEPITPVAETTELSADEMLEQARQTLLNASSFEIHRTTLRDRVDNDTEDETAVRISGEASSYLYSRHGEQIHEVLAAGGLKYTRARYIGQGDVKWEQPRQSDQATIDHARNFIRNLREISGPVLVGTRQRGDTTLYVLEGVSPIPITLGGMTFIEPGAYTLEISTATMAPVRLVYDYVSMFYRDGTPSPDTRSDTTVILEFNSVNGPVVIQPPSEDEVARFDDPPPTPDDRFPATPTPPSR